MAKHSEPEVFRITGARSGLTDDVRARQRRYVISMSVRTASVILCIVLWNIERPLAWAMLVVGAVLPYIAVVLANGGRENAPPPPESSYVPPASQRAIEPSRVDTGDDREAHAWPYVPEDELDPGEAPDTAAGDEGSSDGRGRTGEDTGPTQPEAGPDRPSGAEDERARERGGEPVG